VLALVKLAVQLSGLTAYGWFRDELYYVACSEHLAWGYVDHPPLSIAVLRGWRALFGDSLAAIRLFPAIVGAIIVVLTVRTTRAIGGGRSASVMAGIATLCAPGFLGFHHYYSMNTIDHLLWSIAGAIAVRLVGRPADRAAWLGLGLVLGVGGLNKWSVAWLAAGLVLGLVTTDARRALRTPWPYVAVAIAALLVLPHIAWEVARSWPTLEFMQNALAHKYVQRSFFAFVGEHVLVANPASIPLLLGAIVALRSPRARPLGAIYLTTLALVGASRSAKAEYVLAATPLAFAAGAAWCESFVRERHRAWRFAGIAVAVMVFAFGAATLPFGVPVLKKESFVAYSRTLGIKPPSTEKKEMGALPQFYADMHGWPELVAATSAAFESLDASERPRAKIWTRTGGYGPAAAIDFFGRAHGLPKAICGHNSYWTWGHGDDDETVTIIVGGRREWLEDDFGELTLFATFRCAPWCMPYEDDKPIWIGRGMKRRWKEIWPKIRHFQ
jgi:hypothetical protein